MTKIIFAAMLAVSSLAAYGAESVSEKSAAKANDLKRTMKKGAHRVSEATCMASDAECLARKAKHKASEGKDYVKDKANEIKDSVDSDGEAEQ